MCCLGSLHHSLLVPHDASEVHSSVFFARREQVGPSGAPLTSVPAHQQVSAPIRAQSCPSLLHDWSLLFRGGRLRIVIGTGGAGGVRLSSPPTALEAALARPAPAPVTPLELWGLPGCQRTSETCCAPRRPGMGRMVIGSIVLAVCRAARACVRGAGRGDCGCPSDGGGTWVTSACCGSSDMGGLGQGGAVGAGKLRGECSCCDRALGPG
jgi:hypothetical protein